jgi:hypothetical protein
MWRDQTSSQLLSNFILEAVLHYINEDIAAAQHARRNTYVAVLKGKEYLLRPCDML